MKIVKSYFNNENTLNKGYRQGLPSKKEPVEGSFAGDDITSLAAYEEISPGSMKKLLEIAAKEQEHQHNLDKYQIKSNNIGRYFGYLCGVVSMIAISFFSFLIISISTIVGLIFIIFAFGAIFATSIISYLYRNKLSKNYQHKTDSYDNKNRHNKYKGSKPRD